MATFRQRGDAWRVEISVNGTRESATFDTKTQARAWASKRETELRELSRGKLPDYTLNCAIDRYIEEVCPKHKVAILKLSDSRHFRKTFLSCAKNTLSKLLLTIL